MHFRVLELLFPDKTLNCETIARAVLEASNGRLAIFQRRLKFYNSTIQVSSNSKESLGERLEGYNLFWDVDRLGISL